MQPFVESNDVLDDPSALRKRLRKYGYLFIRDLLPREDVLNVRREVLEICRDMGWLREGEDLMDGLTDHAPIGEGADEWKPMYKRLQSLEGFHKLKLHENVRRLMEDLFEEPVVPLPMTISRVAFPRDNENGTQPHQDWVYVRGSMSILSCWGALGDVPIKVGGLKLLSESHKAGLLTTMPAPGPGGNIVAVDPDLEWHQSDFRAGDLLIFLPLTVHAAAENHTPDRLRISIDFRYAGESHTISQTWMQPHYHWFGDEFSWDALDKEWRDSPTARYWERLPNVKARPPQKMPGW
ncbi:MAG: phytanoyl-CoA dioxygenase family protein [Verrucomicrobia bacterium]|nr:phytanoyl-CoA dioxygenase family protein [Verrucomicrobiota bacterium]MDA1087510.1 phytanoyl-CoA dioxygenase family protein [Verrucomicrobiota bacterium]